MTKHKTTKTIRVVLSFSAFLFYRFPCAPYGDVRSDYFAKTSPRPVPRRENGAAAAPDRCARLSFSLIVYTRTRGFVLDIERVSRSPPLPPLFLYTRIRSRARVCVRPERVLYATTEKRACVLSYTRPSENECDPAATIDYRHMIRSTKTTRLVHATGAVETRASIRKIRSRSENVGQKTKCTNFLRVFIVWMAYEWPSGRFLVRTVREIMVRLSFGRKHPSLPPRVRFSSETIGTHSRGFNFFDFFDLVLSVRERFSACSDDLRFGEKPHPRFIRHVRLMVTLSTFHVSHAYDTIPTILNIYIHVFRMTS